MARFSLSGRANPTRFAIRGAWLAILLAGSVFTFANVEKTPVQLLTRPMARPALAQNSAPSKSPAAPAKPSLNGATLEHFPPGRLYPTLGIGVLSAKGEDMGRIVQILVDSRGEPRAAVIDFGGFLGVGTRKVAIEWSALKFGLSKKPISLDLTRDQIKGAPAFIGGDGAVDVVAPPEIDKGAFGPGARR